MKKILILVSLTALTVPVFGQLNGTGTINDPYYGRLNQNTTINSGEVYIGIPLKTGDWTLTIPAGTTLHIANGGVFEVGPSGRIVAHGTQDSPITFTAWTSNWGHIRLDRNTTSSEFKHCIFEKASPVNDPRGGAIWVSSSSVSIENCTFFGNSAVLGGAIYAESSTGLKILNSIFRNNSASEGGAIYFFSSTSNIVGCTFEGNSSTTADGRGGAICIRGTPNNMNFIDRCKLYSNTSVSRTGGIHFDTGSGGTVQNSLIYGNSSDVGGGVSMGGTDPLADGKVSIINCVIVKNSPCDITFRTSIGYSVQNSVIWGSDRSVWYIADHGGGDPVASNLINCAVQGALDRNGNQMNIESFFTNSFQLNILNEVIDGPNFIDPDNNDYRIRLISPCRDRGVSSVTLPAPVTDLLGSGRVGNTDIGAYEVQYTRWNGTVDNVWGTSGNWNPNGPPVSGISNVIIPSEAAMYPTYQAEQDFEIGQLNDLLVEPGAQVTLNNLINNGILLMQSSDVDQNSSLIIKGTSSGSGLVRYVRSIPHHEDTQFWHYLSSPVKPDSITLDGNDELFYPWNEIQGTWGDGTMTVESGQGYTIIGGGSAVFDGDMVNSDVSIDATSPYADPQDDNEPYSERVFVQPDNVGNHSGEITRSNENYGGGGFNLLGNPYTSALKITDKDVKPENDFLAFNNGAFDRNYKAVYLYDGDSYSYIGIPAGGWEDDNPTSNNGTHIQVGQAFFVLAMNDYSTFTFKREMQDHNPTAPLIKSANASSRWPGLQLKVKDGKHENSTLVIYDNSMTAGLDPGFDVGILNSGSDIGIYTNMAAIDNGVNFARQALPLESAYNIVIPVGIDAREGGQITFSAKVVPIKFHRFLLEDRKTGVFTDIGQDTYTVALPVNSFGTGRFFLHTVSMSRRNLRSGNESPDMHGVRIWTSAKDIIISGDISQRASCDVFDYLGQKVLSVRLADNELNIINMDSAARGAYIVRVIDGVDVYTRKVVFL